MRLRQIGAILAGSLALSGACPTGDTRIRDTYGWVSCTNGTPFVPLSDAAAAALVTAAPEIRQVNATPNATIPTSGSLSSLTTETDVYNHTAVQANPYHAYVTGGYAGTTDQIIQWSAAKWGMPPDWFRAEYIIESYWHQWPPGSGTTVAACANCTGSGCGDLMTVGAATNYPAYSRQTATTVCQSLGLSQVNWNHPDANTNDMGSDPNRWQSTAFNIDYQMSQIRFYFDNPNGLRASWGDTTYAPCQNWLSLAGWFGSYPWNNAGQQNYVTSVQSQLTARKWTQACFAAETC